MPKRLLRGHHSLRIAALLAGASVLAISFASPALAAQNINNGNAANANAQNYIITESGSQAAYTLMLAEADLFNQAPGCDLQSLSGTAQTLDYGCPGLNGEPGQAQTPAQTLPLTGVAITSGLKKFVIPGAVGNTNIGPGDLVTDNAGVIPVADPVKTFNAATGKIKLQFATTGSAASDTLTVNYNPQQGQNGNTTWGNENPFNDFLLQEPSTGSGNGIQELEGTGNAGTVGHSNNTDDPTAVGPVPVSPVDAARSSRAPKLTTTGDFQGLNFVAYAEDAVSYIYWKNYNGTQTVASKCLNAIGAANISASLLKTIWNETYSTTGVPNLTWSALDPGNPACQAKPVYAYWAQNGSGTQSVWATATGSTFPTAASHWPAAQIIFENQTASILKNAATIPIGDVIYFYSYGNFNKTCAASTTTELSTSPACAGTSTNASVPNSIQLGTAINGITLNQGTINDQLPGFEGNSFPGDRLLYNVYADGFNPNIPVSSNATLNALSEDGFLCKPSTTTDIDPSTGLTYRAEIDSVITGEGFFPLPNLQVEDGQGDTTAPYSSTKTGIPHPAWTELSTSKYNASVETASPWNFAAANVDTDNSAVSGTYGNVENGTTTGTQTASATAPIGYCVTLSTDAGSAGQ